LKSRPAVALLLLFLAAGGLWGAEKGGEPSRGGLDMIGKVINFLILFGGLGYFFYKPIRALLAGRREDARRKLEDAREKIRQGEEQLKKARERMSGLEAELLSLRTAAAEEGRAEQERIRRLAREEADRIKRLTSQDMEAQVQAGVRELKRYAAELAAQQALARIRERLTPDVQARLIDRAIEELSKNDQTGSGSQVRPRPH
jgi:F-type H+-transporting ATPase subunit b